MAEWVSTGKVASGAEFHDVAAATFDPGAHEWQVRTWDAADAEGAWSTLRTFGINAPPVVTGLAVTDAAQGTLADATWAYSDPDGNPQAKYQVRHRPGSTPAYPGAVLALDPIRYYRNGDASETPTPTQITGTLGASPVPGGQGRNAGFARVPNWVKPQALTINIWFKCDPGELDNSTSYRTPWGFGTNNWDARFNTKRAITFHAYPADGSWGSWGLTTTTDMDDGLWHMLTFSWDGINGEWASYLDGVLNQSGGFTPQMPRPHTGEFWIGAAGGSRVWAGEWAEFSAHPTALTTAQIANLHAVVADVSAPAWTTGPEVTSATHAGTIDTTGLDLGAHEAAVRVNDGTDWSDWSTPAPFQVLPAHATVKARIGGQWVDAPIKYRNGTEWLNVPAGRLKARIGGQWVEV